MSTTREQLVADWREQLAMAEASAMGPLQQAWLARMRVRLYSFLLACYGEGQWRADERPDNEERTSVMLAAADEQLHGKPARSAGQIRAVLKTVANAQDDPHAPGPLASGLDPDSWIVVATAHARFSTERCLRLLRDAGIYARVGFQGRDKVVEVPAPLRQQAFTTIERNKHLLRVARRRQSEPDPSMKPLVVGLIMACGVLLIVWLFCFPFVVMPELRPDDESYRELLNHGQLDSAFQDVLAAVLGAAFCLFCWLMCGWHYCRKLAADH